MWEEGLKGVFLATNGSANYREAAAPCKPAAKAAVVFPGYRGSEGLRVSEAFCFCVKMSSFVNSMVRYAPGQNIRQWIESRSGCAYRFFPLCLLFFRPFARIVSMLILILARADKYRARLVLAQNPLSYESEV